MSVFNQNGLLLCLCFSRLVMLLLLRLCSVLIGGGGGGAVVVAALALSLSLSLSQVAPITRSEHICWRDLNIYVEDRHWLTDKQTQVLENRQIHGYIIFYGGGNRTRDFRAAAADVIQVRAAATVFKFERGDCTMRSRRREKDSELAASSST